LAACSLEPLDPAAIEPPHIDRRIVAQASRFVVFGNEEDLADSLSSRGSPRLAKVRIPKDNIRALYNELVDVGLTPVIVMPDLEGLSRHICGRWSKVVP